MGEYKGNCMGSKCLSGWEEGIHREGARETQGRREEKLKVDSKTGRSREGCYVEACR